LRYIWLLLVALVFTVAAWTTWPAAWTTSPFGSSAASSAATAENAPANANGAGPAGTPHTATVEALRTALEAEHVDQSQAELSPAERRQLIAAYAAASGQPLWLDAEARPTDDARDALALLERAPEDGLVADDYHASDLARRAASLSPASPADTAAFDVDLTGRLQLFLRDLHIGRVNPRSIGLKMTAPRDEHDFAATIREAVAKHDVKGLPSAWAPPIAIYRNVRTALAAYRELAADTTLTPPPASKARSVKRGDQYDGTESLARLLVALGDLPASDAPPRARTPTTSVWPERSRASRYGTASTRTA
jgi:murein L,D-transpeptidase YcbB/YkuD